MEEHDYIQQPNTTVRVVAKIHWASLKKYYCAKTGAQHRDVGHYAWTQHLEEVEKESGRKDISPHISSSELSMQSGKESHCCFRRMHWPLAHRNWLGRQTAAQK